MCENITSEVTASWESANDSIVEAVCNRVNPADVRCQWPLRVFHRVCVCSQGWGGYDCNQCDFGYIENAAGDECVKRNSNQLFRRQNFLTLTQQQRNDYFRVLKAAKQEDGNEWAVVVSEPGSASGTVTAQNVSVYDMFVVHHFLVTRERNVDSCENDAKIDFAHEGPTFATWHRYYLLIVERELQRVAADLNISFIMPYWDWTPNVLFTPELFGEPGYCDSRVSVSGTLFNGNNWPIVCEQTYRSFIKDKKENIKDDCAPVRVLCDVKSDRRSNIRLERGIISDQSPFLPDEATIPMALAATAYSGFYGFNNRLEGFVDLCAGENNMPCTLFKSYDVTHNNLHNAVHIYLGGHMRVTPSASNDPIFFLHHANIDRIFERWLRKYNNDNRPDYQPDVDRREHPGHNLNDYLVPFFPLKTNADMYRISSDLGFMYDDTPWSPPASDYPQCPESSECSRVGHFPEKGICPSPDAGTTIFRVPLHLILITGTCAVLTAFNLLSI